MFKLVKQGDKIGVSSTAIPPLLRASPVVLCVTQSWDQSSFEKNESSRDDERCSSWQDKETKKLQKRIDLHEGDEG